MTLALFVASCAPKTLEGPQFTPLAGMSCLDLADEQADVDRYRMVIDAVEFDREQQREKREADAMVDKRESEIARKRRALGCA